MKLVNQTYKIIDSNNLQNFDIEESMKHIEMCGRECYSLKDIPKSEFSHQTFWEKIVESKKNENIIEHSSITRLIKLNIMLKLFDYQAINDDFHIFDNFKVSKYNEDYLMSGNLRVWKKLFEKLNQKNLKLYEFISKCELINVNNLDSLNYNKHRFLSIKFIIDFETSIEFIKNKSLYYTMKSINHLVEENELKFIETSKDIFKLIKLSNISEEKYNRGLEILNDHLEKTDKKFLELKLLGFPTGFIDLMIPKISKNEMIVSAYIEDWKKFIDLHSNKISIPQLKQILGFLNDEINRSYLK